jgi:competence protein ComEC
MGGVGLLALFSVRKKEVFTILLWTAFFMTLWNPKILIFDVGFHLSFASTLGLIYLSPIFERYFVKIPAVFCLREAFLMTISAQIATLPIVFYHFQRISLVAPFANVLVAPFVPLSMFFGFASVFLSWIHFGVGKGLAYIAWLWLEVILNVAYFFANF